MSKQPIRVMIADDEELVCEALALILEVAGFRVVGVANTPLKTVEIAERNQPDVIMLDVQMAGRNMLGMVPKINEKSPDAKVLPFSAWSRPGDLARAVVYSTAGYVTKDKPAEQIIDAIERAVSGQPIYDRDDVLTAIDVLGRGLARKRIKSFGRGTDVNLTPQELRILTLIAQGLANSKIAGLLEISETTVKTHVGKILHKLNLPDRTSVAVWAYTDGGLQDSNLDSTDEGAYKTAHPNTKPR